MDSNITDFLREATDRAVSPVGLFKCSSSQMCVTDEDTKASLWVVTQYVGGRHGCGWEQDGFWARSSEIDGAAPTQGYTFESVRTSTGHLIEPICAGLAKHFADAKRVSVRIQFTPYPNYPELNVLLGDTEGGVIFERPEPPTFA